MRNEFDKQLKNKLEQVAVPPSAQVWENISGQLDNTSKKKGAVLLPLLMPLFKYGMAASVAFLLGGVSVFYLTKDDLPKEYVSTQPIKSNTIVETNDNETGNESAMLFTHSSTSAVHESTANSAKIYQTVATNNNNQVVVTTVGPSVIKQQQLASNEIYTSAIEKENEDRLTFEEPITTYSLSIMSNDEPEAFIIETVEETPNFVRNGAVKDNQVGYNGFWFGPVVKFNGLGISNQFSAGYGAGFDFGYDFAERFGFSSGIQHNFNQLRYETFSYTEPVTIIDEKANYNAVAVPLSFRYKITKVRGGKGIPSSINLVNGMDYAYFYNQDFHSLGFSSGLEYDLFVKGATAVTFGLKGGMMRNFAYRPPASSLADSKLNFHVGAYAAMRFIGVRR